MENTRLTLKRRFKLSRFFKGEKAVSGPLVLTQRRVFILPTRRGLGLVLTIVLLLLMAFIYNNNLVYFLAFLLASIFFITILHTFKALSGLVVQAGYAQPVFAGESAGFQVTVSNPAREPRLEVAISLDSEQVFALAANESKGLTLYAPAVRRGWLPISTVTLSSSYPFGIFRAWSPLRFDSRVLVYPKPSRQVIPFPLGSGEHSDAERYLDRQGNEDFNGIRAYRSGDSLRQIHWKAYAKGQGLVSKQYASQAGGTEMWLNLDSAPGAGIEERLGQLCRWIIDAEQAGLSYGLQLPGKLIAPDTGLSHYETCLEALALL